MTFHFGTKQNDELAFLSFRSLVVCNKVTSRYFLLRREIIILGQNEQGCNE